MLSKGDIGHQNPEILKFIRTMMYVSMTLNVTRRPWLETVYAAKSLILNYLYNTLTLKAVIYSYVEVA